jgi:amidase
LTVKASNQPDLWQLSATELAAMIRAGEVAAREVVEAHLERIGAVNPAVNAVTATLAEPALEQACRIDALRQSGAWLGPLAGVPFTVKENIDVAGSATTHGVPALKNAIARCDSPLVERLRMAGAIPIARTNLPDLSLRFHTFSSLYGHTVNPWNKRMSPGGSSGGESVALATGMSPLGLGNDAGGSVRAPALFGGVASLKPSYGRFPADQSVGPRDVTLASQLFPVNGVLARRVADLRAAFNVLAGPDPRDPRVVPAPLVGPALPPPIRVAVCANPGGLGVQADVAAAVERAAFALADAGYSVEQADVPRLENALDGYGRMVMTEFQLVLPMLERLMAPEGRKYIELAMRLSGPVRIEEYLRYTAVRQGVQRDWALFLDRYPILLGPVFTEPAVPVGFDVAGIEEHRALGRAMRLSVASTFVGVPAVSVPAGLAGGLPQGVQLISSMYREDLCLAAAAAIEERLGVLAPIDPVE